MYIQYSIKKWLWKKIWACRMVERETMIFPPIEAKLSEQVKSVTKYVGNQDGCTMTLVGQQVLYSETA